MTNPIEELRAIMHDRRINSVATIRAGYAACDILMTAVNPYPHSQPWDHTDHFDRLFGIPILVDASLNPYEVRFFDRFGALMGITSILPQQGGLVPYPYTANARIARLRARPGAAERVDAIRAEMAAEAERRLAAANILSHIDDALADRCVCGCGRALYESSPSAWFASEDCQARWQSRQAQPIVDDDVNDPQPRYDTTNMRVALYTNPPDAPTNEEMLRWIERTYQAIERHRSYP